MILYKAFAELTPSLAVTVWLPSSTFGTVKLAVNDPKILVVE